MTNLKSIDGHIGHFGNGTGASGIVDEVKESRKIALRVHAILTENGVPNSLYEDKTSKTQKENIPNLVSYHNKHSSNALVVSYHLNASGGQRNEGIGAEVLYKTQGALAKKLVDAICGAGGFRNRGAKFRNDLAVLNDKKFIAILLETFFVNSKADVELYNKNFEKICFAIAKELAEYIGYKIKEKSPSVAPKTQTEKVPHRIKSGSYSTLQKAEDAKKLVGKNGIASEKYIVVGKNVGGGYFFQTGAYASKEDAEKALEKMKVLNILTNGHILKA